MAQAGIEPLLWTLATSDHVPGDLASICALPASILWQAEIMHATGQRIAKRAKIEAAADAAIRDAARKYLR